MLLIFASNFFSIHCSSNRVLDCMEEDCAMYMSFNRSKLVRMSKKNANNSFGCWFFSSSIFKNASWTNINELCALFKSHFASSFHLTFYKYISTSFRHMDFVFVNSLSFAVSPITVSSGSLLCSEHARWCNLPIFSCFCVHFVCMHSAAALSNTQSSWYLYKFRLLPRSRAKHAHAKRET